MKNTMMNWVKVSIISWQLKHKVTFGEKSSVESGDDNAKSWKFEILKRVFLKKVFFFKKRSDLTLKKLFQIIQKVFKLNGDISFVMLFILLQRIDTNILSNVYLSLLLLDFWICIYPL